jgi:hypothetical protein
MSGDCLVATQLAASQELPSCHAVLYSSWWRLAWQIVWSGHCVEGACCSGVCFSWVWKLRQICVKRVVMLSEVPGGYLKVKCKAVLVAGSGGSYGSETLRFAHFTENRFTDGWEFLSLKLWSATLYPPGRFLVLVLVLGAESTLGS